MGGTEAAARSTPASERLPLLLLLALVLVTLGPAARVQAQDSGFGRPAAGSAAASSDRPAPRSADHPPESAPPVVRGQVFTLAGLPLGELQVRFTSGSIELAVAVAADGTFELSLPAPAVDTAVLIVDAAEPLARTHHPSLLRLAAHELADEVRLILIPMQWTIGGGFFVGRPAALDLKAAFEMPPGETRLSLLVRPSQAVDSAPVDVQPWPAGTLPIPIVFLRAMDGPEITARDSAAFWRTVERFHQHVGREIFRPAAAAGWPDGSAAGAVTVEIVRGIYSPAVAGSAGAAADDPRLGWIAIREPAVLHDPYLVTHELMHTLHFGHTCAMPSVMSDTCNHGPRPTLPTLYDVAFLELRFAVEEAMLRHRAAYGILEAFNGDRVVIRQLAPEAGVVPLAPLLSSYRLPPTAGERPDPPARGPATVDSASEELLNP